MPWSAIRFNCIGVNHNFMSLINSFTQLFVWQKAHGLALQVYRLTSHFPKDERLGLTN